MNTTTRRFPRRVLMTADTIGGVWTYALELARALAPHGIEIGLATMGARLSLDQRSEIAALANVKVFESSFKLEWMDEPRADVERAGDWLLELEASFGPDMIHLNNFSHGSFPWRAPKIVVGHSCVLSWWRAVHGCDAPPEWNEYHESVMAGLHSADLVVAPSASMLSALKEHYGPFKKSCVIHNGRELPAPARLAKHDFILAAGRLWDAGKNITALADIAPNLPWPVMIAGQETHPDGRATRHRNLTCLGQLASGEIAEYFQRASIYSLPARYEPFGLSALEAGLARCALVLGDIPSFREIWDDNALFVPPDDPAALEWTLKELISKPEEISRLGEKARSAARHYTLEKMAAGYLAAYESLLVSSSAHAASHFSTRPQAAPPAAQAFY